MHRQLLGLLLIAVWIPPSHTGAGDVPTTPRTGTACLSYEPTVVTLSGRLERRTYPGRPNYESVKGGDEPEIHFYLNLSQPVCTEGDRNSPVEYPQEGVTLIQLVLNDTGYKQLRPLIGRTVTLKGGLFAGHTAHHHAPLLLNNVKLTGSGR